MRESKTSKPNSFSFEAEKQYYSQRWPQEASPYFHLENYLRCWLNPEAIFRGMRILDIGAGECTYTRLIADRFNPKQIVACELFPERMLPAWQANQNPVLKAVVGDCFHLPFRTCSFDVVIASLVLHQLPDLKGVVSEIARILKAQGLFVGWDPNPFNLIHLYRYLARAHSTNQFLFWPGRVRPIFELFGFDLTTQFFCARLPWTRNRFLGTCIGSVARLRNDAKVGQNG